LHTNPERTKTVEKKRKVRTRGKKHPVLQESQIHEKGRKGPQRKSRHGTVSKELYRRGTSEGKKGVNPSHREKG